MTHVIHYYKNRFKFNNKKLMFYKNRYILMSFKFVKRFKNDKRIKLPYVYLHDDIYINLKNHNVLKIVHIVE